MSLDLDETRRKLDELNEEIVDLIEQRMELVVEVAEYKDEKDIEIVDKEREEEVKEEFEQLYQKRNLPEGRGKELAEYLIATAIDREEKLLGREIPR